MFSLSQNLYTSDFFYEQGILLRACTIPEEVRLYPFRSEQGITYGFVLFLCPSMFSLAIDPCFFFNFFFHA